MTFLLGLAGSFLGGIAFGPINLSVVDLTLKKNLRCAIQFSIAAAIVEIIQASIALMFGKLISNKIAQYPEVKLLVIAFFLAVGLFFVLKSAESTSDKKVRASSNSNYLNGFIVAILNPQTIPYWIFVIAYLKTTGLLYLQSYYLLIFLFGVSLGKFFILSLYGYMSDHIKKHCSNLNEYVSKGIGGLLIAIGLVQAINYFFF